MISKNFIKSSLIYTLTGALPMASALILLPIYIANLTPADYGALSVYLVFAALVQILVMYSFDSSLYIHFHEFKNDKPKLASFISSAFVLMLMIGAGVGMFFFVAGDLVFKQFKTESPISFYPYGLIALGTGIFQSLLKVYTNLLQSRQKAETFFWANLFNFLFILSFTYAGIKLFPQTLMGPLGGRLLAGTISCVWVLYRVFSEFGFHFNYPLLRSSFSFNFYTFIYQVQQWLINSFDRVIMALFIPLSGVGVYDLAMKCVLVIELMMNGLNTSSYPKVISVFMSQEEKRSTPEINRYYNGNTAVVMLMICMTILLFPLILQNFLSSKPAYMQAIPFIPYVASLYFFRSIRLYFAVPYSLLKYMKPLPLIYLVVSAVKIVLMIVLLNRYHTYGVIVASFASLIVEIILLRMVVNKKFVFRYNALKLIFAPLFLFAMILILEPFFGQDYGWLIHSVYLISCGILLWWIYRNELKLLKPLSMIGSIRK